MTDFANQDAPPPTKTTELPDSPQAMAKAVVEEAMAERETLSQMSQMQAKESRKEIDTISMTSPTSGNKRDRESERLTSFKENSGELSDAREKIKMAWEDIPERQGAAEEAMELTRAAIFGQIELLIQQGLDTFHTQETLERELERLKEEKDSKEREVKRLRSSEAQSRATISVRLC